VRTTVGGELAAAKLMGLYDGWCVRRGAYKFDWQVVARELRRLGFAKRKSRGVVIYCGLAPTG
jgi:hypothetical protein